MLQLDVTDLRPELRLDLLEGVVGDAVPAFLGDAARHQQSHLELVRGARGS